MKDLKPTQGINEWLRREAIISAAAKDKVLQGQIMAYSAKHPMWWISTFVWTKDPRKQPSEIPFSLYKFQHELVYIWLGEKGYVRHDGSLWPLILDKSRDMGVTWVIVASIAFGLIFREVTYGMMTRVGTELDSKSPQSLFGKLDFIFNHLPKWMVDKKAIFDGRLKMPHQQIYGKSSIEGSLTTIDAFRQQRHTRTFVDEAPTIKDIDKLLESIQDVTYAPCLVGTPKGKNAFYKLLSGKKFKVVSHKKDPLKLGNDASGWLHRRLHYSIHPDKDPKTEKGAAWYKRERESRSSVAWAQEQEISYEQSAEGRVWPSFSGDHVFGIKDKGWKLGLQRLMKFGQIVAAWDFGTSMQSPTCVVVAGIIHFKTMPEPSIYVLDYHSWKRQHHEVVANEFRAYLGHWGVEKHWGDVAGGAKDSSLQSWIDNLRSCDISIEKTTTKGRGRDIRDKILHMIERYRFYIGPEAAKPDKGHQGPSVVDVMYQYRVDKHDQPIKDEFSHLADCLQYICLKGVMMPLTLASEKMNYSNTDGGKKAPAELLRRAKHGKGL